MTSSHYQSQPGKQLELRVAASNLEFDAHLAAQTIPENQKRLPGYLHLFSEKKFMPDESHPDLDRDIDRARFSDTQLRGLQMKVFSYTRNKFSLTPDVEKAQLPEDGEWRVNMQLHLGLQAAKTIMVEPFFTAEQKDSGIIPVYYSIPYPVSGNYEFSELQEYLSHKPPGIVDELMLVKNSVRHHSIRTRTRKLQPAMYESLQKVNETTS